MSNFKVNIDQIDLNRVPQHVAIIMDGNGRWAKNHGYDRLIGHASGVESIRSVVKGCGELGIKYLTIYAFSTENWNRPPSEVEGLMNLLVDTITSEVEELHKNGVKMSSVGDPSLLPLNCQESLRKMEEITKNNDTIHLQIALNYSARWDIITTVKNISKDVKRDLLSADDIDENIINQYSCFAGIPDPELLIRTSGECRISNFMLWQLAYTELYFTEVLWPDFRKDHLYQAVLDYQSRERRFGKISEQLED